MSTKVRVCVFLVKYANHVSRRSCRRGIGGNARQSMCREGPIRVFVLRYVNHLYRRSCMRIRIKVRQSCVEKVLYAYY
jgi:hypothetical protein